MVRWNHSDMISPHWTTCSQKMRNHHWEIINHIVTISHEEDHNHVGFLLLIMIHRWDLYPIQQCVASYQSGQDNLVSHATPQYIVNSLMTTANVCVNRVIRCRSSPKSAPCWIKYVTNVRIFDHSDLWVFPISSPLWYNTLFIITGVSLLITCGDECLVPISRYLGQSGLRRPA